MRVGLNVINNMVEQHVQLYIVLKVKQNDADDNAHAMVVTKLAVTGNKQNILSVRFR